jgi:hypothetical protein
MKSSTPPPDTCSRAVTPIWRAVAARACSRRASPAWAKAAAARPGANGLDDNIRPDS